MTYDPTIPNSWQQHCTSELLDCLNANDGASKWARKRVHLAAKQRIIIADADLSSRDIRDFDFRWIYFTRINFNKSQLAGSNFQSSILSDCDLNYCDISGSVFKNTSIRSNCFMMHIKWDSQTNFLFQKGPTPSTIDVTILDLVESAWRRDEFNRNNNGISALVANLTGYGQSIPKLFAGATILVLVFSAAFFTFGASDIRTSDETFADCLINSLKYFIALTDSYEDSSKLLSFFGTIESCLGLAFLALLISAITKKFVISR